MAVNTFWDLGRNDLNTIWLHQAKGGYHRFVGYYENSGEFIGHYVRWLKDWAAERDVTFGEHYWPSRRRWREPVPGGRHAGRRRAGIRPARGPAPRQQV